MSVFTDYLLNSTLTEAFNDKGFARKKLGINISSKEISGFFEDNLNTSWKNQGELLKDFNAAFGIDLPYFQQNEINFLVDKYLTKTGRKFKVSQDFKDSLSGSSATIVDDQFTGAAPELEATKIKDLSKGVVKKFKIPPAKGDKLDKFVLTVIKNMMGKSKGKLLLTGDPGTGKTSTIKQVISLLKMNIITVEAPHISEENIISVPYLIRKGNKETAEVMDLSQSGSNFEVINAESNLITQLKRTKKLTDAEYNTFLNSNKILKPLAEQYKRVINERLPYTNVLFIDELYRVGNQRIQNLFRTILNGNIGTTPIPKNTYIIYASNMDNSDGSLDDISLNQQFNEIEFDKPSKVDFMRYMADRYTDANLATGEDDEASASNAVNPVRALVFNRFEEALTAEDLGGKDESTEAGIRVSPRRWEEIIKYVNAGIPPKDLMEARRLLTFLKDNMSDYMTKETSNIYPKYEKLVKDLIEETTNLDLSTVEPIQAKDWRDNFEGQLAQKLKMGEDRKYVPIISGKPGLGKTALIDDVAKRYGIRKIVIDASVLNPEDVIGLTTPGENPDGTMSTEFTEPPLYKKIMEGYKKDQPTAPGSKYTHMLMLDELSRTNTKVFNGIRSLMLDKKVGSIKLPDDIMIVGAMNPDDIGTNALSDHMKDVVDVVQAEGNLTDSLNYFKKTQTYKNGNTVLGVELSDLVLDFFKHTLDTFKSDVDTEGEPLSLNDSSFYWTDNLNVVYISPREFDDLINGSIEDSLLELDLLYGFVDPKTFNLDDIDSYVDAVTSSIREKYLSVTRFIMSKHGAKETEFGDKIEAYLGTALRDLEAPLKELFETNKSEATTTFVDLFREATSIQQMLDYDGIKGVLENIIENSDVNDVISDLDDIIAETTHDSDVVSIFDSVVDMFKLLRIIDWTKYSAEITSNVSNSFVEHSLKPTVERLRDASGEINGTPVIEYLPKHMKDYDLLLEMVKLAVKNKNNMFV